MDRDKPEIFDDGLGDFADYVIGEYSHLYKVETFHRLEDAEEGTHVTIEDGLVTQDRDMRRNSSLRRTSVALHFWSEVNEAPWDKFVVCVFQHKGNEYVKVMHEADYILTQGGTRGY